MWDTEGRDRIDFGAGIAVNALGHQDPDLLAALTTQAQKLWHSSNMFYTEPPLRLAEELVTASGFAERVFLCTRAPRRTRRQSSWCASGRHARLLLLQAGSDVLHFVPPLTITDEELAEGLARLHAALRSFAAQ